jgi:type VI secretion system protein ImpL
VDQFRKFSSLLKSTPFPPIDLKPYQELARQTLNILYQDFLNALSSPTDTSSLPTKLLWTIQRLSQNDVNQLPSLEELRKISSELTEVVPTLGEAGKTWLDAQYFNPGKEFDAFFDQVDTHKLFGRDVTQFLVDQTAIAFDNLKLQLSSLAQVLSDDAILPSHDGAKQEKPSLSRGLLNLEKSLNTLFSQPYMVPPSGHRIVSHLTGKIVHWDDRLIQTASDLCRSFDDVNTKGLAHFPPVVRESMLYLARKNLQENVLSLVARAQSFVDMPSNLSEGLAAEEVLRSKITDIREISPKFVKLLELLNKDAIGGGFIELRALLCKTSYWLLGQVDKMLNSLNPYIIHTQNYTWWDGKQGAALTGYAVRDFQDLRTYVDLQRQQIQTLALEYAQPLVAFLSSQVMLDEPEGQKDLLNKWRRIVEQMDAFSKKQPGNSVAILEDFILQTLNNLDIKTIFQQIEPQQIAKPSGDYFIEVTRQIKRNLLARAEIIKRKNAVENYKKLATYFNEKMRNQFPFVSYVNLTMKEVSPEIIREFFRLYDEAGGSAKEILDQVYQLSSETLPSVQFLELMDTIKAFFQAYLLGQGENDMPTFEFAMDFRANRDREKGGDLIVDWTFKPDEDSIVNKNDKARQGRWVYGNPVEISFRWPDGETIPEKPYADSKQPALTVSERTATFRYTGRWSLLWLLKMHGTPKGEYFIARDPNPYMLKFSIPLGGGARSTVYNLITLLAPSANPKAPGKVLQVPNFPTIAPELPKSIDKYMDQSVLVEGLIPPQQIPLNILEFGQKQETTSTEKQK